MQQQLETGKLSIHKGQGTVTSVDGMVIYNDPNNVVFGVYRSIAIEGPDGVTTKLSDVTLLKGVGPVITEGLKLEFLYVKSKTPGKRNCIVAVKVDGVWISDLPTLKAAYDAEIALKKKTLRNDLVVFGVVTFVLIAFAFFIIPLIAAAVYSFFTFKKYKSTKEEINSLSQTMPSEYDIAKLMV